MSNGFKDFRDENNSNKKTEVTINVDEVNNLIKKYKKIKKYMKSSLFCVKTLDGTETFVSDLIKEAKENPID